MRTGRKTRLRRILRRKRVKRAIKAYGNYIAAGVMVFVVCMAVVGAAVKPTASTQQRIHQSQYRTHGRRKAPQKKRKRTRSTLCHLTGTGKHWTAGHVMKCRRTTQTTAGIYRNVCSSTHT